MRVCRSASEPEDKDGVYYDRLKTVEVVVITRPDDAMTGLGSLWKQKQEQMVFHGVRRLVGYCRDVGLVAVVRRRVEEGEEEEWDLGEEEGEEDCCCEIDP